MMHTHEYPLGIRWALAGHGTGTMHPVPVTLPRCMLCILSGKLGMEVAEVGTVEHSATALLALSTGKSFGFQLHAGT